jgi:hypothetical protein
MYTEVNNRHTHFEPFSAPISPKSLTSGPDAGSLDVEGGYPVPVYSFPITTSNPKKNGYRMTTQKRMIKISIEVKRGSTRFKVAAQAESIEEALEMARRYNSGKECKVVFPIDPEGFFVRDNKISPTSPTPATSTTVSTRVWS